MDSEKRKKTNKLILKIFGIGFVAMVVFALAMKFLVVDPATARHEEEMIAHNAKDSVARIERLAREEAAKAEHDRRMKTDRRYRDSVNAAYRAEQKAAELAAREQAKNGIGVSASEAKAELTGLPWKYTANGEKAVAGTRDHSCLA